MSVTRRIAKNALFNLIANNCDLASNFIVGIMLARVLGTEQYGAYSYIVWALGLAVLAVNLGVGDMLMRFVAESLGRQQIVEAKSLIRFALILRFSAVLVVAIGIIAFAGHWARLVSYQASEFHFILLAVTLIPNAMTNLFPSAFAGFQKYEFKALVVLSSSPLRVVLIMILLALGFGLTEVLIVNACVWSLSTIVSFFILGRIIPLRDIFSSAPLDRILRNRVLRYSLSRAGIWALNYFAWGPIAVLFIGMYLPVEQVGFYTLSDKLSSMAMAIIPAGLTGVLLPSISEQFGQGDMERIRKIHVTSVRYVAMLALPTAVAGAVLAHPLIELLYGADYTAAVLPMQILFVPAAVFIMGESASMVILGIDRPVFLLKVSAILAVINVGLLLWLTPMYGLLGAAIATSLSRVVYLPLCARYVTREIKIKWPLRDISKVVCASLIMGGALYGLGQFFSSAVSIGLSVPVGLAIYGASLLILKTVSVQDIAIIRQANNYVPVPFRKSYLALIRLMEKAVRDEQ